MNSAACCPAIAKHYPAGIDYVIVNGQVVIDKGANTGALPGRAIRRGRPST